MSNVIINNEASPFFDWLATDDTWKRRAMKSLGFMMQKEIKAGIKSGAPGGKKYKKLMPDNYRTVLDIGVRGIGQEQQHDFMGNIAKAVGYQYKDDILNVGWLSPSAVRFGSIQELGDIKIVTQKMRDYFFMVGVPLSPSTTVLHIPARPTYEPMKKVLEPKMSPYLEQKILEYMSGNMETTKESKRRRKYVVYG